ncbi:unnamed protein product [Urochloa humidicola]
MSTRARGGGGGGRQYFPVGRRRYVPVVDAGCGSGCRPRRPRPLLRLPSFLKPCQQLGANKVAVPTRRSGAAGGEQYTCASTSTASFSSSSAATHSSGYSSAAYSSDDYFYAAAKQQQATKAAAVASPAGKKQQLKGKKKKKWAAAAAAPEEESGGVGVAVEKESSDPRADFRESMVQMVVEMGLCDWDGLRGMLGRLLALNAPRHHAAILTAFAEVCTQLAGAAAAATAPTPPHQPSPPPAYHHQYRR